MDSLERKIKTKELQGNLPQGGMVRGVGEEEAVFSREHSLTPEELEQLITALEEIFEKREFYGKTWSPRELLQHIKQIKPGAQDKLMFRITEAMRTLGPKYTYLSEGERSGFPKLKKILQIMVNRRIRV
jgi:hypothetical protein